MVKVTIELWPFGSEMGKKHLGTLLISNDVSGDESKGNYKCRFFNKAGRKWRKCFVRGFPRKRLLAWDLLYRALREVVGNRNAKD